MHSPLRWLGIILLFALTLGVGQAADFFYRDGDTPIAFLGDSITDNTPYGRYIEAYVLTRFPKMHVTFRNIGWSGDTSWLSTRGGFENGMKRDILSLQPAAITIDFGMNDARGGNGNYARYIEYSTKLVQQLKAVGTRVALVTPSPEERYEADKPAGSNYNLMLWKYSWGLKEIADKEGVLFIDQYTPFVQIIENGRKAGVLSTTPGGPRLIPDGVHPNAAGHIVMAAALLKGMHAPALVSRVAIDGETKTVIDAKSCKVEFVGGADFAFKRTDEALPWPLPSDVQLLQKIPGFTVMEDLNRYELKVTNLKEGTYNVTIDDVNIGDFTKTALADGVNLALQAGPITTQTNKIVGLINEKAGLFFTRWRNVQIYTLPVWVTNVDIEAQRKTELARLDALIAEKEHALNDLRQPLPHIWKLTLVKSASGHQLLPRATGEGAK